MQTTSIRPRSPASRLTDPATSHEVEEHVNASGIRDGQARVVFEALRRHEGATAAELARAMGLDRHAVARRLPDLEKLNLARKGESRRCRVTRKNAITWYIARPADQLQGRLF